MLKVKFYTVGDLPKGPFQDIREKLLKPLKQFVQLEHIVIKDESSFDPKGAYTIVLEATGHAFSSESFAAHLQDLEDRGEHVAVLLGGAKGLSDETKNNADLELSLSKMTTTHDMAHIFFLEQLYRAMTIAHGKTYHY